MAETALELITRSYYLSQIVARGYEVVSGEQISDGLKLLNELLTFKASDERLIPYYKRFEFPAVIGQEMYFVENLLSVETITFNIGPVRYSMQPMTRDQYFGQNRVDNIQSLPFSYYVERAYKGSNIYVYFLPQSNYPMKISGKFGLEEVGINDDLSAVYDSFYLAYLRYELAVYICTEYAVPVPAEVERQYRERQKKLMDVGPPDLSIKKIEYFGNADGLNWGDINIGRGWRPYSIQYD